MASDFRHKYPYTDNHELNMDWLIREMKKLKIKVPDCPTDEDGQYALIATVSDGTITYQWQKIGE